eukprot:9471745-Pyramimonas_sp.AAC.1
MNSCGALGRAAHWTRERTFFRGQSARMCHRADEADATLGARSADNGPRIRKAPRVQTVVGLITVVGFRSSFGPMGQ